MPELSAYQRELQRSRVKQSQMQWSTIVRLAEGPRLPYVIEYRFSNNREFQALETPAGKPYR